MSFGITPMERQMFSIICPISYTNKIWAIKALRTVSGLGLKDAKDALERPGVVQHFKLNVDYLNKCSNAEEEMERQFTILRNDGVTVNNSIKVILDELRILAMTAISQKEDELGNEILQLVLTEKLRRGI